jgi:hypothetical protein
MWFQNKISSKLIFTREVKMNDKKKQDRLPWWLFAGISGLMSIVALIVLFGVWDVSDPAGRTNLFSSILGLGYELGGQFGASVMVFLVSGIFGYFAYKEKNQA